MTEDILRVAEIYHVSEGFKNIELLILKSH